MSDHTTGVGTSHDAAATNGDGQAHGCACGTAGSPLDTALAYLRAGLSVVPIRTNGSKRPSITWERFQKAPAPENAVRAYWHEDLGIAIIGGRVSGNAECIDFDRSDLFAPWAELVEAQAPGLVARLCVVRTPGDGNHAWYRCPGATIPGNTKLAMEPGTDPKTGKPKAETLIETRGEGGYALAPGSPPACHPARRTYDHVAGPPLTALTEITPPERDILIATARSFDRLIADRRPSTPAGQGDGAGLRPGDDFDLRGPPWPDIIEPHGWTQAHQRGETVYWRRPGKDDPGWSATTGYCRGKNGEDLLAVFSSNADPFEGPTGNRPCSCHGKFTAYALLNHGGDFKAAAKELAAQGYGEQRAERNGRPAQKARPWPGGSGGRSPVPGGADEGGGEEAEEEFPTAHQIILAYLRERYQPVFRRESALYSASLGRPVRPGEACNAPTYPLVVQLAFASDAPRDKDGPCLEQIPKLYRTWAAVAWQDLLAELPDEPDAAEVSTPAAEDFRQRLTDALLTPIPLGHTYRGKDGGERTETQRRALIDWAALWAKPGPWRDIRSYRLWHRLDEAGRLHVAIRVGLFGQSPINVPELARLQQREFARLAELYGVGIGGKAGGERVVVLNPDFVAEVRSGPAAGDSWTDGRMDGETHTHARETCAHPSKSAQGDTAPTVPVDGGVDGASARPRERPRTGGRVCVDVDGDVDGDTPMGGERPAAGGEREPGEEG